MGKSQIAKRVHDTQNLPGGRKLQKDTKNPLLNDFDMDNTLLNNLR